MRFCTKWHVWYVKLPFNMKQPHVIHCMWISLEWFSRFDFTFSDCFIWKKRRLENSWKKNNPTFLYQNSSFFYYYLMTHSVYFKTLCGGRNPHVWNHCREWYIFLSQTLMSLTFVTVLDVAKQHLFFSAAFIISTCSYRNKDRNYNVSPDYFPSSSFPLVEVVTTSLTLLLA